MSFFVPANNAWVFYNVRFAKCRWDGQALLVDPSDSTDALLSVAFLVSFALVQVLGRSLLLC